jgi:hypothetical protein
LCRFELGRVPANTKLNSNVTVRRIRVRGGHFKFRALRLDSGAPPCAAARDADADASPEEGCDASRRGKRTQCPD